MTEDELTIVRRAYAKQVMAAMEARNPAVEDAFAAVPREAFLGAGPWPVLRFGGTYVATPSADPVYLYTNDLVGIDTARRLNNGQPSLHAYLMACAAPHEGEHAVHVGAGVGYYSAILSRLVGETGRVTAIEYDAELARRARGNLEPYANTRVVEGDGAAVHFDDADVIYVNAGATRPADIWLDRLRDRGRLVLPLTTDRGFDRAGSDMGRHGAVFLITRNGEAFEARRVSSVAIFPCVGLRDEESEQALETAFARNEGSRVTSLVRRDDLPAERCWLRGRGWSLTID